MRRRHLLVWLLAGVAVACRSEPTPRQAGDGSSEIAETHPEETNAIHLTADMVRDLRISTAVVAERAGAQEVTVLGEIAADQERYAEVTPVTSGQVVRVLVQLDASVRAGAPLVQMRSPELGRSRADLLMAEARRDLARQTLDRKRGLANERIVALREAEEADAAFRAADADARAAAAAVSALGIAGEPTDGDASLFYVRSPIAGRIIDRHVALGQHADPSVALFTVADLSRVWVMAQAFERDAVTVRVGSVAHVTLAALPGEEFDGRVAVVGRQVDAGSRTLPIRIELANRSGVLRPGMSASAGLEVRGQGRTILTVPAAAVQRVGDRWLVFLPKSQTEYEMRAVGRGRDLGNDLEVVSGLRAGETVVVDGAFLLKAEAEKRSGGADEHGH